MIKVDFTFYENDFEGTIIPSSLFSKYIILAQANILRLTLNRATFVSDEAKTLICLVAEYIYGTPTSELNDMVMYSLIESMLPKDQTTISICQ